MLSNIDNIESKLITITLLPLYDIGEIGLDYYNNLTKNANLAFFIEILLAIFTSYLDNSLSSILSSLNTVIARSVLRIGTTKYINISLLLNISKAWLSLLLVRSYLDS